jgi:ketosteroid isomerase-like protein
MKNNSLLLTVGMILVLSLASCNTQSAPELSESPEETRKVVQSWMNAHQSLDADKLMSCYAEDVVYLNVVIKDFGTVTYDGLNKSIRKDFQKDGFRMELVSSFISPDGKFAAIQGTYYDLNSAGRQISMPIAIVLEFRDGEIVKETDYFDGWQIK